MDSSSDRLFNRETTVHEILGGGFVADVILWREKNITVGILLGVLSSWLVFEKTGYTFLSFVSSVFLLLLVILFLWSKSAAILNRPAPPLPHLRLSEEMVNEAAVFVRIHVNTLLSASEDIAMGRDTRLFFRVAVCLLLISLAGSLTGFVTFTNLSILSVLTVPALYERFEDYVDIYIKTVYKKLQQLYRRFEALCTRSLQNSVLEKQKLS